MSTPASAVARSSSNLNPSHPAVKRIMREALELQREPSAHYIAAPLEDNLFDWHFTVRGLDDSDFQGGRYHGRILLPSNYPLAPPDVILLTPSGRFQCNTKICLSVTSYHADSWQPAYSIRTVLTALISFMNTPPAGAIGSLDYPSDERKAYARQSRTWKCEHCGEGKTLIELLPDTDVSKENISKALPKEVQQSQQQQHPTPPAAAHTTTPPANHTSAPNASTAAATTSSLGTTHDDVVATTAPANASGPRHRIHTIHDRNTGDNASAAAPTPASASTSASAVHTNAATPTERRRQASASNTSASLNAVTSPLPAANAAANTSPHRRLQSRELNEQQYATLTVVVTALIILILLRKVVSHQVNGSDMFAFDLESLLHLLLL